MTDTTESVKMYEFLAWLETNKKKLMIGAGVLAAIAIVFSFVRYQANQRELAANEALFKLGLPLSRGEIGARPNATAYLKVATDYANTRAGERAVLMAAGTLFGDNNYAAALDQFRKFQSAYPDSPLASVALLGVAACLDSQDKTDEAVKTYQEVLSRYVSEPVANQARLALARICESKKQPEQALKLYDDLARSDALGMWRNEVALRRDSLFRLYPQLAPTNQNVLPTTSPTRQQVTLTPVKNTNSPTTSTNAAGTNSATPKK
jgi:predicted negative regulator of RcsB-dependent stress response